MTAIVIFTWSGDADCLARCLDFCHMNVPQAPVFVFDDSLSPIPHDHIALRYLDNYERTTFARRGNLNGRECVMGMLACMLGVAGKTGADRIIKLDSDTAILKQRILEDNADLVGVPWGKRFISGACYSLATSILAPMLSRCATFGPLQPEEDAAMTQLARSLGAEVAYRMDNERYISAFDFKTETPVEAYRDSAVTFGNHYFIPKGAGRKELAAAMSCFYQAKYLRGSTHPADAVTNPEPFLSRRLGEKLRIDHPALES